VPPVSIEIDIASQTEQAYTATNMDDEVANYRLPAFGGTYSLSYENATENTGSYAYEPPFLSATKRIAVAMSPETHGTNATTDTTVAIQLAILFTAFGESTSSGEFQGILPEIAPFRESCYGTTVKRWLVDPDDGEEITDGTAAYDANCCFPGEASFRAWIEIPVELSGHTFPYSKTVGGVTYLGMDVTFRVTELRYLYDDATVVAFDDIGQTVCEL
jgi:hypothetical protein